MAGEFRPALAIVGPTASGKSSLAVRLAALFRGEVVTCDALQVYRHMNIGTAKPSPEEREGIPHHMLDLREPHEDFSAGDYQRLAREVLMNISDRNLLPIVAGGTGFYFRALIEGLFEGPGRSEAKRARLRRIAARRGTLPLHRMLRQVDPETAARVTPADGSRIIRALEIYLETGKNMWWWQSQKPNSLRNFRWLKIGIAWDRPRLYERINRRVEEMFRKGFTDEVKRLLEKYPATCHAFTAIGYRQIVAHLQGRLSLEEAIAQTQQASRRYAKRQLTWFRSDREVIWLPVGEGTEGLVPAAARLTEDFLAA